MQLEENEGQIRWKPCKTRVFLMKITEKWPNLREILETFFSRILCHTTKKNIFAARAFGPAGGPTTLRFESLTGLSRPNSQTGGRQWHPRVLESLAGLK